VSAGVPPVAWQASLFDTRADNPADLPSTGWPDKRWTTGPGSSTCLVGSPAPTSCSSCCSGTRRGGNASGRCDTVRTVLWNRWWRRCRRGSGGGFCSDPAPAAGWPRRSISAPVTCWWWAVRASTTGRRPGRSRTRRSRRTPGRTPASPPHPSRTPAAPPAVSGPASQVPTTTTAWV